LGSFAATTSGNPPITTTEFNSNDAKNAESVHELGYVFLYWWMPSMIASHSVEELADRPERETGAFYFDAVSVRRIDPAS